MNSKILLHFTIFSDGIFSSKSYLSPGSMFNMNIYVLSINVIEEEI